MNKRKEGHLLLFITKFIIIFGGNKKVTGGWSSNKGHEAVLALHTHICYFDSLISPDKQLFPFLYNKPIKPNPAFFYFYFLSLVLFPIC